MQKENKRHNEKQQIDLNQEMIEQVPTVTILEFFCGCHDVLHVTI
jgi:hypothetical protein